MSDQNDTLSSPDDIDAGISSLSTDDWIGLNTFFNSAIFDNPTTEKKMRIKLGMQSGDEFKPEFAETVDLFENLADLAEDFKHDVADVVLNLCDDIVHYNTKAQVVYPRLANLIDRYDWGDDDTATTQQKLDALVELWGKGESKGRSEKIKDRFRSALEQLIKDAKDRADRADNLHAAIMGTGNGPVEEDGILNRLKKVSADFDAKKTDFARKFGTTGSEVVALQAQAAEIQAKLIRLRKKDRDEVIVLSTSPAYLAIPLAGPFIMAGVQIGVGVDLANVRAEITSLVKKSAEVEKKLGEKERFSTYYTNGKDMAKEMVEKCEPVAKRLQKVGLGWRAISKDLEFIVSTLTDEGRSQLKANNWGNFIGTLATAELSWAKVAQRADHFRSVAQPAPVKSADELADKAAA